LRRALALVALTALLVAVGVMFAFDPDRPFAVPAVVLAIAAFAGALVGLVQPRRPRARGRPDKRVGRRAVGAAVLVALLLMLRVADALTVITGGFVVGAFLAAELILSARPSSR